MLTKLSINLKIDIFETIIPIKQTKINNTANFSTNLIFVGTFPELKHTQFTWFGNLPTPRSYWLY